jgi:hypothetical protein
MTLSTGRPLRTPPPTCSRNRISHESVDVLIGAP